MLKLTFLQFGILLMLDKLPYIEKQFSDILCKLKKK